MATPIFTDQSLTNGTAVDSNRFSLPISSRQPPKIILEIGNAMSSAEDDNLVSIDLYYSPNYVYEVDSDDAIWIQAPSSVFRPIRLLVGGSYAIGAIGSGNEYHEIIPIEMSGEECKLTAQRLTVGGAGTNTITINAWIEE